LAQRFETTASLAMIMSV